MPKEKLFFTLETEKKLKQIMDEIFDDMRTVERYAGTAYCTEKEDESEAKFWLGQYRALKRTYNNIEKHMFTLIMKREAEENA